MWVIGLAAAVVLIIIYPCLIAASRADDELEKEHFSN